MKDATTGKKDNIFHYFFTGMTKKKELLGQQGKVGISPSQKKERKCVYKGRMEEDVYSEKILGRM